MSALILKFLLPVLSLSHLLLLSLCCRHKSKHAGKLASQPIGVNQKNNRRRTTTKVSMSGPVCKKLQFSIVQMSLTYCYCHSAFLRAGGYHNAGGTSQNVHRRPKLTDDGNQIGLQRYISVSAIFGCMLCPNTVIRVYLVCRVRRFVMQM